MPYIFAVALYAVFLIAPGIPHPFDGIPFDTPYEALALAGALPLLFFIRTPMARVSRLHLLIIPLIIIKIVIGNIGLKEGLAGSYYTGGDTTVAERSTAFVHAPRGITRFDRELNFTQAGYDANAHPLPLWFLNDNQRFAIPTAQKISAPLSVEWKGYLYVPAKNMMAIVVSDGAAEVTATMPEKEAVVPIVVRYTASSHPDRFLTLLWDGRDGGPIKESLYPALYSIRQIHTNYFLKLADYGIKAITLIALIILLVSRATLPSWRAWLGISWLASFSVLATRLTDASRYPYFNFLDGGTDPLTYETYARYLQFTGNWSMAAIEQGSYYYQPYYYFLTLMHYLGGEGLFSVFLIQGAFLVGTGLCLAEVGRRMVGVEPVIRKAWPFILIAPAFVLMPHIVSEATMLFPSVFGIFFASLTTLLLIQGRDIEKSGYTTFACAGIALGLGILNRFNFLSWLPLIILWIFFQRHSIRRIIFFALGLLIVIGPAVARNKAVSGYAQLFSRSNATINFIKSAPPETSLYVPQKNHPRLTVISESFFDGRAIPVVAWIAENPVAYMRYTALKARDATLWLSWSCILFLISSGAYLYGGSNGRKIDYLLIGLFPIIQTATVLMLSDNSMRYHLPALAFMVFWSAALAAMLQISITRIMHKPAV